jgi:tagatose-1,6-bisphosphate aldolase non-catalytic subunit AgaZ/GatZ
VGAGQAFVGKIDPDGDGSPVVFSRGELLGQLPADLRLLVETIADNVIFPVGPLHLGGEQEGDEQA